jgi:hypothetical protein
MCPRDVPDDHADVPAFGLVSDVLPRFAWGALSSLLRVCTGVLRTASYMLRGKEAVVRYSAFQAKVAAPKANPPPLRSRCRDK